MILSKSGVLIYHRVYLATYQLNILHPYFPFLNFLASLCAACQLFWIFYCSVVKILRILWKFKPHYTVALDTADQIRAEYFNFDNVCLRKGWFICHKNANILIKKNCHLHRWLVRHYRWFFLKNTLWSLFSSFSSLFLPSIYYHIFISQSLLQNQLNNLGKRTFCFCLHPNSSIIFSKAEGPLRFSFSKVLPSSLLLDSLGDLPTHFLSLLWQNIFR